KRRLKKHINTVTVVGYSPDGKQLITGGLDQAIYVWNAETGVYGSSLQGHRDGITSLVFSADGKWMVTGCDSDRDTATRVWLAGSAGYRDGVVIGSPGNVGPTALAVHPISGDLVIGRGRLVAVSVRPYTATPDKRAEAAKPDLLQAKTLAENRFGS